MTAIPRDEWTYRTPSGPGEATFKEQGSSFHGLLSRAPSTGEALDLVEQARRRFHDATHHCWAYRVGWAEGLQERSSDAGEPARTAGVPILSALQSGGISDACLVVVRYFGGVKLGTGGLARAYRAAALMAVDSASLAEKTLAEELEVTLPYAAQGSLRHAAAEMGIRLTEAGYGQALTLGASVPRGKRERFGEVLRAMNETWKGGLSWKSK